MSKESVGNVLNIITEFGKVSIPKKSIYFISIPAASNRKWNKNSTIYNGIKIKCLEEIYRRYASPLHR